MKRDIIKKGDIIPTIDGYVVVTGYSNCVFITDNYIVDFDGEEWKEGERLFYHHELELLAKQCDGENHRIVYED